MGNRALPVPRYVVLAALLPFIAAAALGTSAAGQERPAYPRAQVESAEGRLAPDFTLNDQDGRPFTLSARRGKPVILYVYRGHWLPYCMRQLREFAQRIEDFEKLGVKVIGISVDDREHAHKVWTEAGGRKIPVLSDEGATVIRRYGLLHAGGRGGSDIAIRATILIGADGRERWRRISESAADTPTADEILERIARTLPSEGREQKEKVQP